MVMLTVARPGSMVWGDCEDGYQSGALRRPVDAGLVDMNDLVEIWKSASIPKGPFVLHTELPEEVKSG